jgi:hypothetical protein
LTSLAVGFLATKDKSADVGIYYDPAIVIALVIFYKLATSVEFTPNAKFIPFC